MVAVWILQPVDKMLDGSDTQRLTADRSPAVRSRAKANQLWSQLDVTIVVVDRLMVQSDTDHDIQSIVEEG